MAATINPNYHENKSSKPPSIIRFLHFLNGLFQTNFRHTGGTVFTYHRPFRRNLASPITRSCTILMAQQIQNDGYNPFLSTLIPAGSYVSGLGSPLFGTTYQGGIGYGAIYEISPDGKNYQAVYKFDDSVGNGVGPAASLVNVGGKLFGACSSSNGGIYYQDGTAFEYDPFSSAQTTLHLFIGSSYGDGYEPQSTLVSANDTLFGTTEFGDSDHSGGTIFKINTDGSGYQIIYDFDFYDVPIRN